MGLQLLRTDLGVNFEGSLKRLKRLGFEPSVIFDVGVALGTPELYVTFPKAKYFLIDPIRESVPYMEKWANVLNAEVLNIGLWDTDTELRIDVRKNLSGSTFFEEVGSAESLGTRVVPVRRFDSVFTREHMKGPSLVKLDIQGAELRALKGMGNLLNLIDILVVEVSTLVTVNGGAAQAFEVIDYLRSNSFTIYDISQVGRRPLDKALAQVDFMFCKMDSFLVRDRRWNAT